MQNLFKIVEKIKKTRPNLNEIHIENIVREYLQILVLKTIYSSKYGKMLSFMGGTCLRICYDLKRFSEDLDFALNKKNKDYSFKNLNEIIKRELELRNFTVDTNVKEEKVVQKSFIKIAHILESLKISKVKSQKLHIKIEVDVNPVSLKYTGIESFFVTKFNEIFPIIKHDLETLFAGKILAILQRPYSRGRDYYDLIWYLNEGIKINLAHLNAGLKLDKKHSKFKNLKDVVDALDKNIIKLESNLILKDMNKFLEDRSEEKWIRDYDSLFKMLSKKYLKLFENNRG